MADDPLVTNPPPRVLLDTNTLVAASDPSRRTHAAATAVLGWPARGSVLHTTTQVIREYLVVSTRPDAVNGLGLSMGDALLNVAAFRDRIEVLNDSGATLDRLLDLVGGTACSGKQVHDANIVATMLTHGVQAIVTDNVKDFARFDDHIEVIPL